jgi:hypothetical protein
MGILMYVYVKWKLKILMRFFIKCFFFSRRVERILPRGKNRIGKSPDTFVLPYSLPSILPPG